jgi:hypothetical protein
MAACASGIFIRCDEEAARTSPLQDLDHCRKLIHDAFLVSEENPGFAHLLSLRCPPAGGTLASKVELTLTQARRQKLFIR